MPTTISGDDFANMLYGGPDDEILDGRGGDDTLFSGDGNDVLDGGQGNDMLFGGAGHKLYRFERGDGQDTIQANDFNGLGSNAIQFGDGIGPQDLRLTNAGGDLVVALAGTGDQITVRSHFAFDYQSGAHPFAVDGIRFADGMRWDAAAIAAHSAAPPEEQVLVLGDGNDMASSMLIDGAGGNDELFGAVVYGGTGNDTLHGGGTPSAVLYGGSGDDLLQGGWSDDFLIGGSGNDTIDSGAGHDTIVAGRGAGHDLMLAPADYGTAQRIELRGVFAGGAVLTRSDGGAGPDLEITLKGSTEGITVAHYFDQPDGYRTITLAFEDAVWSANDINGHVNAPFETRTGTDGNDWMQASMPDAVLDGGAGNDYLNSSGGASVLVGGEGDDYLMGGAGSDTFDGGAGNDTINDMGGDNFVLFGRGSGADQLEVYSAQVHDTVLLADDVAPADVRVTLDGMDLRVTVGAGEASMRVLAFADTWQPHGTVELRFADGTVWDRALLLRHALTGTDGADYLVGTSDDNVLTGGAGDDVLMGGAGRDTYIGGAGNDIIDDSDGASVIVFGHGDGMDRVVSHWQPSSLEVHLAADVTPDQVMFTRPSDDTLWMKLTDSPDLLAIDGVVPYADMGGNYMDKLVFADGTVWDHDAILAHIVGNP